jgi:hypothetical protein
MRTESVKLGRMSRPAEAGELETGGAAVRLLDEICDGGDPCFNCLVDTRLTLPGLEQ